jgi:hypothetical protein
MCNLSFKHLLVAGLLSASVISCRTAELAVNQNLKDDTEAYSVKGRQGFQIGQTLSFGDFKTSKVDRDWTFSHSIPFIVRFQGAKEKLGFTQFANHTGNSADVAVVSKFKETEYEPIKDYFSVALKHKNYFAGGIRLNQSNDTWDFIVHQVDGSNRSLNGNGTVGYVRNSSLKIDIAGIRELEGSSSFITQNNVYGYEFLLHGKVVGTVSTIDNGKVWLRKELSEDVKLVLASVSSGLLLRNSVEEKALSMK